MHYHRRISNLPINNILIPHMKFRRDKKHMGFQILLNDETIWDFPKDFVQDSPLRNGHHNVTIFDQSWYNFHLRDLYKFLRRYLNTSREELDNFTEDYVGLRDILLAGDKRRGKHRVSISFLTTNSSRARKVAGYRLRRKTHNDT